MNNVRRLSVSVAAAGVAFGALALGKLAEGFVASMLHAGGVVMLFLAVVLFVAATRNDLEQHRGHRSY